MNRTAPVNLTRILSWLIGLIIVLVPFHAFLTVWLSSLAGHYTALRLWKEGLLFLLTAGCVYLLVRDRVLARRLLAWRLVWLIAAYLGLLLICGLTAAVTHNVTPKAMLYGLLVDSRFLIFFLAVMIIAARDDWLRLRWQKLLLGPAILVAAVAILQYLVLPYDFLRHFGYSQSTIFPYETINHNLAHIRVMSTLRGANPLGTYLIIPISVLAAWLFYEKRERRDKQIFGAGLMLALIFSFSRGAWLGTALSLLVTAGLALKSAAARKAFTLSLAGLVILAAGISFGLRNNLAFQNAVLHTDRVSTARQSSNQGHIDATKLALKDIYHQPLGAGVGTAGPQSVYNRDRPARIAEDYFLQVGQETGVLGMGLFIAICAIAGKYLFDGRRDPFYLALLAGLIGISLVNLLSHAWSDDTLAYIWWGLLGIALAPILTDKLKRKNAKKIKSPA